MKSSASETRLKKILYTFGSLNDLAGVITSDGSIHDVMRSGLYLTLGTLSAARGAIFHFSAASSSMELVAQKGVNADGNFSFRLGAETERALLMCPHVVDLETDGDCVEPFLAGHSGLVETFEASFLSPLRVGGKLAGILLMGECFSCDKYYEEDLQILAMMSQQLSVALYNHKLFSRLQRKVDENRSLYENLRQIYMETIQAFATAIDAKDDYTKGHSARVAQYAVTIGEELGLSGDELEGIRLAGLLHDIGKITVDSAIIRKESCLDSHEIMQMNKHPSVGYEILSNINFPWGDLSQLARHHHETLDGKGYPDGVGGEDLLLGARIITLSDCFDAMTSDRPYRKQIGFDETLREINRGVGTQFDAEVVRALFDVLEKELSGQVSSPRILSALDMEYDPVSLLCVLREMNGSAAASAKAGEKGFGQSESPHQ